MGNFYQLVLNTYINTYNRIANEEIREISAKVLEYSEQGRNKLRHNNRRDIRGRYVPNKAFNIITKYFEEEGFHVTEKSITEERYEFVIEWATEDEGENEQT